MVPADRRLDLIADGFDLAIRIGELQTSSMIGQRVGTYRFAVVASPDFLARHGTPRGPGDFGQATCLLNLNMSPRNRWPFWRDGRQEIAEVAGALQIDNGEALRVSVLEGAGLAYLPIDLVSHDVEAGRLVRLLPDWQTMTLPINLVHPSRRVPRRVSTLMQVLADGIRVSHPL